MPRWAARASSRSCPRICPHHAAAGSSPQSDERNRRSVYIFVRRNTRYPMLEAFDMPDTHESCSRRDVTTTAPQALTMLNDKVALEWARAFAGQALAAPDPLDRAFRLAYSRPPDAFEKDTAATFLHKQKSVIAERAARGEKLALPSLLRKAAARTWNLLMPRHSSISARCCSTPTNSSTGTKP